MTLQAPPQPYLCRALQPAWIAELKKRILTNPTRHVATLPCMIRKESLSSREDFDEENMHLYEIYTIGGNHLRTALQVLKQTLYMYII